MQLVKRKSMQLVEREKRHSLIRRHHKKIPSDKYNYPKSKNE